MKRRILLFAVVVCLAVWQVACGGGNTGGVVTTPPTTSAPTVNFTATPTAITSGQSSTLAWTTTNATTVSIDNGIGSMTPVASGTKIVSPTATTTYTLVATNANGSTSAAATVTVTSAPPPPPASTVTSVTVMGPATVPANNTAQFAATVNGTGSPSQAVTWSVSASAGTITTTGLFTPLATAAGSSATITATSVQDKTKSGTATVAVQMRTMTLSTTTKRLYADYADTVVLHLTATGACNGDTIYSLSVGTASPSTLSNLQNNCGSNALTEAAGIGSNVPPSNLDYYVTGSDGAKTNTVHIPYLGSRAPLMAMSATEIFYAPSRGMPIQKFKLDGTADGTESRMGGLGSISYDAKTKQLVGSWLWGLTWTDPTNTTFPGANGVPSTKAIGMVAANNGVVYATMPYDGLIGRTLLTTGDQIPQPLTTFAAGTSPVAIDAETLGGNDFVLSVDRGNPTLDLFDTDGNLKSTLPLNGLTPSATVLQTGDGGWMVKLIATGPAAWKAVVVFLYDNTLIPVSIDPGTLAMTAGKPVALTGDPIGLSKDELHGRAIVTYADQTNGGSTFASVDLTGDFTTQAPIPTPLTSTFGSMAADTLVSPDGTNLYPGGINQATGAVVMTPMQNK